MTIRSVRTYRWDRGRPTEKLGVLLRNEHGYLFVAPEDVVEVSNRLVDWVEENYQQHDERETP